MSKYCLLTNEGQMIDSNFNFIVINVDALEN